MNSIGSLSSLSNVSSLQPTYNVPRQVGGGDADNDNDGNRGAGRASGSNLVSSIMQALGQTLSGGSSAKATQDPQAALQSFVQDLFSAIGGNNGAAGSSDADRDNGVSGARGATSNAASNLQNLIQQLSANDQSSSGGIQTNDTLSNLKSSFQNLVNSLNAAQSQSASPSSNAPTLQSFLQNLSQELSNGQNISGALVSIKA